MNAGKKPLLTAGILFAGGLLFVALSFYPFQYGTTESLVIVGLLVLFGIVELVLDDTSF